VGESHERMKAICRDFGITLKGHRFEARLTQYSIVCLAACEFTRGAQL
jgi:hypothetical protein